MDELRSYNPSLNDRIAQFLLGDSNAGSLKGKMVEGLMGSTGLGKTQAGVVDFVPGVSNVLFGDQAVRDLAHGNYSGAAWNIAGAIPGSLATAAFSRVGKAALSSMGKAAQDADNIASRSSFLYDPPIVKQRPFEADYPHGAQTDDLGRLTMDMDGRPLTARFVSGRTVAGEGDTGIPTSAYDEIAEAGTGRLPQAVTSREIGGDAGRYVVTRDRRSNEVLDRDIYIRQGLDPDTSSRTLGHEIGHMIDELAGGIPTNGLTGELKALYNTMNNGMRNYAGTDVRANAKAFLPQHAGYKGGDVSKELMANAIHGNMVGPNYVKTVAPDTAARIRRYVNDNPKLKNIIQFNSVAAAGGAGALAMQPDEAKGAEMSKFHITAPDGSEYEVEGENQEGALAALQQHLGSQSMQPDGSINTENVVRTMIDSVPVAGPLLSKAGAAIDATIDDTPIGSHQYNGVTWDDRYQQALADGQGKREAFSKEHPYASGAARLAGNVAGVVPMAAAAPEAAALGLGEGLLGESALSAGTGAALNGGDTLARGGSVGDAVEDAGIGAIAGGAIPSLTAGISGLAKSVISPFTSSPERAAAVNVLEKEGIPLSAGQKTGSKFLQYRESELGGHTAQDLVDKQAKVFTDAVMQKAGGSGLASSENMSALRQQLSDGFDAISSRNALRLDKGIVDDVQNASQEYARLLPSEQKSIFDTLKGDIGQKFRDGNGIISGEDYQTIRSRLSRRAQSAANDPEFANALRGLRDALDNGMERSVHPSDVGTWQQLRRNWGNMRVIENAISGAGGEQAGLGYITPARLRMAAASGNRAGYAGGKGDFAQLAKAAQAVMSPLPNSGTAGRMMAHGFVSHGLSGALGAAVGAHEGGVNGALTGAVFGSLAPSLAGKALMSKPVQAYLSNRLVTGGMSPATQGVINRLATGVVASRLNTRP